jgi:hypothetical protein
MKDYKSEINILWKCHDIINKQFDKQYLKDWKYNKETQKPFMEKMHIICNKIISLQWYLYK